MGYSKENGYVPGDIDSVMVALMGFVNSIFNLTGPDAYTIDTFVGSGFYKFYYAMAQKLQENEIKTSEIFLKLQEYIIETNEKIARSRVTNPGIIDYFEENGWTASVKKMIEADAGRLNISVDVDDGDHASGLATITAYASLISGTPDTISIGGTAFTAQAGAATPGTATFQAATSNALTAASLVTQINAHATVSLLVKARRIGDGVALLARLGGTTGNAIALVYVSNGSVGATVSGATLAGGTDNASYAADKLVINNLVKNVDAGGVWTGGNQTSTIALSNGQSFDFSFQIPNRIPTSLKLTVTLSENNTVPIDSPQDQKDRLLANIQERYSLGLNFEPQKYFDIETDAPWASIVLLEWSHDSGATWSSSVYDASYDDFFDIELANITLIEVT